MFTFVKYLKLFVSNYCKQNKRVTELFQINLQMSPKYYPLYKTNKTTIKLLQVKNRSVIDTQWEEEFFNLYFVTVHDTFGSVWWNTGLRVCMCVYGVEEFRTDITINVYNWNHSREITRKRLLVLKHKESVVRMIYSCGTVHRWGITGIFIEIPILTYVSSS